MMQRKRNDLEVESTEKYLSVKKSKISEGLLSTHLSANTFLHDDRLDLPDSSELAIQVNHFLSFSIIAMIFFSPKNSQHQWYFLIENVDHEMLNKCTKLIRR